MEEKYWEMLRVVKEIEAPSDFEAKFWEKLKVRQKAKWWQVLLQKPVFVPVLASIIGFLLGVNIANIATKKDTKTINSLAFLDDYPPDSLGDIYKRSVEK